MFAASLGANTMFTRQTHLIPTEPYLGQRSGRSGPMDVLLSHGTVFAWKDFGEVQRSGAAPHRHKKWQIMADLLQFAISDYIATITLNRPDRLNAFTDEMLTDWLHALDECHTSDDIRVVVITGAGRAFTTGGDVGRFNEHAASSAADIKSRVEGGIQRLIRTIAEIDKPVIAALNGLATGGGLDVALACDIRFASESARFAETYVRMGMIPGGGGAYLLPRLVGSAKALEMLWSAEFVDARDAERIGLVNRVYPDEELMQATFEFATRLAQGAPLAVQLIKRVVRLGLGKDLATGLELAAANMPVVRSSKDHLEALSAYREKRQPAFKGK
jgi:enoyl-CoA hydratase/carnithine racemase